MNESICYIMICIKQGSCRLDHFSLSILEMLAVRTDIVKSPKYCLLLHSKIKNPLLVKSTWLIRLYRSHIVVAIFCSGVLSSINYLSLDCQNIFLLASNIGCRELSRWIVCTLLLFEMEQF